MLRMVSIASDGETKRGGALVLLTCKKELSSDSSIYPFISPHTLRLMNFLVGDDDITADKDYRHVFKRLRNLFIRPRGVTILDVHITPIMIQSHLRSEGHSEAHIRELFKPNDKQDVGLAYKLLKDMWSLSETSSEKTGFARARKAIRILGRLCKYILFPYICIDLTLSEQLRYLSAAAHLNLVLFRASQKDFFPTLLFGDITITIKNVYFCVARAKVDLPYGQFYLILLGTDGLEKLFGILRTMVGSDANVDILQLVTRLTGTTEVANILARRPDWDHGMRRLRLPALARDASRVPENEDHLTPSSWRGDVLLNPVSLQTCWRQGKSMAMEETPEIIPLMSSIDSAPGVDILRPFGSLILSQPCAPDDNEDEDEDQAEPGVQTAQPIAGIMGTPYSQDLEDAVAAEDIGLGAGPRNFSSDVILDGHKLSKARALAIRSKHRHMPASTDRLRRVADENRYIHSGAHTETIIDHQSAFGDPSLMLSEPIATLICCEKRMFLAIAEVVDIQINSNSMEELSLDLLMEDTATVTYQVVDLIPATHEDDPALKNDWRSTSHLQPAFLTAPGRLVQPINPTLSTAAAKPFFLFDSAVLVALADSLTARIRTGDIKRIPTVPRTQHFPYREKSGMFSLSIIKYTC